MGFYTVAFGHRLRAFCGLAAALLGAARLSQIGSLGAYHRRDREWGVAPMPVAETERPRPAAAEDGEDRGARLRRRQANHGDGTGRRRRDDSEREPSRGLPRVVGLDYDDDGLLVDTQVSQVTRDVAQAELAKLAKHSIPRGNGWVIKAVDGGNATGHEGRCGPMYDWQTSSFPNCNSLHELDLGHMKKINSG